VPEVPGIAGWTLVQRFGSGHQAELRSIGAAQDHQSGLAESGGEVTVGGCNITGLRQCAISRVIRISSRKPVEVFQQERHSTEGAIGQYAPGFRSRFFKTRVNDGVEGRVPPLDTGNCCVDQLQGGNFATAHQSGLCRGIERCKFVDR